MEFKKCVRCGNFFVSNENVCSNCAPKDRLEISKLKNFFEVNQNADSINSICAGTGISEKNLNRYLNTNEFNQYNNQINFNNNEGNISNNL